MQERRSHSQVERAKLAENRSDESYNAGLELLTMRIALET